MGLGLGPRVRVGAGVRVVIRRVAVTFLVPLASTSEQMGSERRSCSGSAAPSASLGWLASASRTRSVGCSTVVRPSELTTDRVSAAPVRAAGIASAAAAREGSRTATKLARPG